MVILTTVSEVYKVNWEEEIKPQQLNRSKGKGIDTPVTGREGPYGCKTSSSHIL
jgi:hypothetical protein